MNLDELRSVQAKERRKDSLQHLRDDFYDDVAAYVSDLKAARDRRAAEVDRPFQDDDVRRLSDEVETAEEVAEALYERRVGKVVKLASFEAADMPVEQEGMTSQERALFEDLVARIGENKSRVLDALTGEAELSAPSAGATDTEPVTADGATPAGAEAATEQTDRAPPVESETVAAPGGPPEPSGGGPNPPGNEPEMADGGPEAADGGLEAAGGGPESTAPAAASVRDADAPDASSGSGEGTLADAMGVDDGSTSARSEHTPVEPESAPPGETADELGAGSSGDSKSPGGSEAAGGSDSLGDSESPAVAEADGGDGRDAADSPPATPEMDRTTVRITADVGGIFGVDEREYDLASEDVVTLPEANAEPLVQRDAAERLD